MQVLIKLFRYAVSFVACALNLVILSSVVFVLCTMRFMLQMIFGSKILSYLSAVLDRVINDLICLHSCNLRRILQFLCGVDLQCHLPESLSQERSYVMVINHRSQVDILIILAVFYDRIPDVKFFLKQSLFWTPFLGQFCYLMNYIFVQRLQPDAVRRDPTIVHRQREKIRQQCRQLSVKPVTLAVFAEGARYCSQKTVSQKNHFTHLLSPQPAGLALALEATAPLTEEVLDVTLAYDVGFVSVWLLLSGQVRTIEIHADTYDVQALRLVGDYAKDRQFRKRFTEWVRQLWSRKDALLHQILVRYGRLPSS